MDASRHALLTLLADGAWHTGVQLGADLGLSRAAIWKQIRALRNTGLTVVADRRRGYRLGAPLELLAEDPIRKVLSPETKAALARLDVLLTTASTSEILATMPAPAPGAMFVCVAEYQSGGRGRRQAGAGFLLWDTVYACRYRGAMRSRRAIWRHWDW